MAFKAIETIYNGYRFRSRLEARWAVFFDALGVKYEYEKEGFDLDGMWYLPDFWLPEFKTWIEIKSRSLTEDEHNKCRLLSHYRQGESVLALCGNVWPGEHTYQLWQWAFYSNKSRPTSPTYGQFEHAQPIIRCFDWPDCEPELILSAYTMARQARFEHGEKPIISRRY